MLFFSISLHQPKQDLIHFLQESSLKIPWIAAIFLTLLIGTAVGLFQGLLVGKLKLQAFIVTLLWIIILSRAQPDFSADDTSINISDSSQNLEFLRFLGEGSLADVLTNGNGSGLHSIPMSFIYLICFAIFGIILHKSVFG